MIRNVSNSKEGVLVVFEHDALRPAARISFWSLVIDFGVIDRYTLA